MEKKLEKLHIKIKKYEDNNFLSEEKISIECNDLESAKNLFECLNFRELIRVRYQVFVMKKGNIEFAFQLVDNLGLLLEYEDSNNYVGKSSIEIKQAKEKMFKKIKQFGIKTTDEIDVKKATELIYNKINNKYNI